jgi:hypothetical protein
LNLCIKCKKLVSKFAFSNGSTCGRYAAVQEVAAAQVREAVEAMVSARLEVGLYRL